MGGEIENTIAPAFFSHGGGIHIDPSKKGTFTAAATKHGKSVQGFASQVLANKENYSPAMVKRIQKKYKGRTDKLSMDSMHRELAALEQQQEAVRAQMNLIEPQQMAAWGGPGVS